MKDSFRENSFFNLTSRVLEFAISMIVAFLVARYLGKTGYGRYSLILAVVSAVVPFVDLGLSPILVREMVRRSSQAMGILVTGTKIRFIASLGISFILGIWLWRGGTVWLAGGDLDTSLHVFKWDQQITDLISLTICVLSMLYVRGTVIKSSQDFFLATLSIRYDFLATLFSQCVKLLLLFYFIHLNLGITGIFLAFLASDLVYMLSAIITMRNKYGVRFSSLATGFSVREEKLNFIRQALPIGIATFLYSMGLQIDKFVLQWFRDAGDVGLFSAIYRIVTVLFLFIYPVINVLLPRMTRESGEKEAEKLLDQYGRMVSLLSVGLVAGILLLIMFSPIIIRGFGVEFREVLPELRWLIPDLYFVSMSFFFLLAITTREKQVWVIFSGLVVLTSNFIIDIFLVESWGVKGAVTGTVVSDVLGCTILFMAFCREFGWINPLAFGGPAFMGIFLAVFMPIIVKPLWIPIDTVTWGCFWGVVGMCLYCFMMPKWREMIGNFFRGTI